MPSVSFRQVAAFMDAAQPPSTLTDLIARHRWLGAPPKSLRHVLSRHVDDPTRSFYFLNYNTFLLPGVNISWDLGVALQEVGWTALDAILAQGADLPTLLAAAHASPEDVLKALYTPLALADALGLPHSDLEEAVATVLNVVTLGAINLASDLTFDIVFEVFARPAIEAVEQLSIGAEKILSALHLDPLSFLADLITLLAKGIVSLFGVEIPYPLRPGAKPALEERAVQIGQATAARGYDIMAFSEVWRQTPSAFDAIVGAWSGATKALTQPQVVGPDNPARVLDSGLLRLCAGLAQIVDAQVHPYSAAGSLSYDMDAFATKGILLTRIKLTEKCTIDLYGTHLLSGGDGPLSFLKYVLPSAAAAVSDSACNDRRLAQVQELLDFYRATHDDQNIGIICGDTNIVAEDSQGRTTSAYAQLKQQMNSLGLRDLWDVQRAFAEQRKDVAGPTHGAEGGKQQRFNGICTVLQTETSHDLPLQPQIGLCNEAEASTGERIDFIFVEDPTPKHRADLDLTRLVRNPFVCNGLPEDQLFLSDHLGLELRFLVHDR